MYSIKVSSAGFFYIDYTFHPMKHLLTILFVLFLATQAEAATYWMATTGSDANACNAIDGDNDPGAHKATFTSALACLSAGDTLRVKAGTYNQAFTFTAPSGTSSGRTKIIGDGVTTIIRPTSAGVCSSFRVARIVSKNWVEIGQMKLDANNVCNNPLRVESVNDSVFHHLEIVNGATDGVHLSGGTASARNTFQHLLIHDNGQVTAVPDEHGFYHSCAIDTIIEHSEFYSNGSHGFHGYCAATSTNHRMILRYNYSHDNASRGFLIGSGADSLAHHNIITGNGKDGIAVGFNTTSNGQVYNNSIYSNGTDCVEVRSGAQNSKIKNNLCLGNANNAVVDNGTGSTVGTNRLSTDATLVVDAPNNRFSPRADSVLIDAGEHISGFSSGKFLGVAPDQGALEFAPTTPPTIPGTPTSLQVGTK